MADRNRERVGGIMRARQRGQAEQELDHLAHLGLFSAPVADHRPLDLRGRVFNERNAGFDRRQHGNAPSVTELQRAADVGRVKQVFDRNPFGLAVANQDGELTMDRRKTIRKAAGLVRANGATGDEAMPPAIAIDAAIARAIRTGVDAEYPHASEASISFSSMSKFDHTCCTSSWSSSTSISLTICDASFPWSLT